jgi:uncharacterized protein YjbJ (UPF0337 family)
MLSVFMPVCWSESAVDGIKHPRRRVMNWDQVEGKWKQVRGKVKEQWGKLTDDDIDVINGKRQQFVGKIQQRYGLEKDAAEKQVDAFVNTLHAEDREAAREAGREEGREQEKARGARGGR